MTARPAPTRARLIHLLIEERAARLAGQRAHGSAITLAIGDDRDRARREIEAEVLRKEPHEPH